MVGPRLSKECRERDLSVTDKAAAEILGFDMFLYFSNVFFPQGLERFFEI